jgi:hypothetical protein
MDVRGGHTLYDTVLSRSSSTCRGVSVGVSAIRDTHVHHDKLLPMRALVRVIRHGYICIWCLVPSMRPGTGRLMCANLSLPSTLHCSFPFAARSLLKGLLGIYDRYTSKLEPNGQNAVIHLFLRIMY